MHNEILLVIIISSLAVISPGSDFAVVVRNALQYSERSGYATALGVSLATWVHTLYCITGVAVLIAKTPFLLNGVKMIGAAYLIYLGIKSIFSTLPKVTLGDVNSKTHSVLMGFKEGFISNATNPKTTLFYLSLFTMVINPKTSIIIQICYGFIIFVLHLTWFGLLSYLITHPLIHKRINSFQIYLTKGVGIALMLISFRILYDVIT